MKYVILSILVLFSLTVYGQVEDTPLFVGKYFGSQSGGGSGYWQVSGTFTDESGYYDATSIQEGDILFFVDAGIGYHLPIDTIISASGSSFIVRVLNDGISGVSAVPNGPGGIYRANSPKGLWPDPAGLTAPDRQTLNSYLIKRLNNEPVKQDTFITVTPSTNYIPNLVIDQPSRFYNNIYISCKGVTDTSVVAFLAAPTSDHYGVVYNVKNDSGLVETRILSDAHFSNTKTAYLLRPGQMAQVRALKDQRQSGAYKWAVNLLWDSTVVSGGGGITALTGDVTASGTGSVVATIANNSITSAKVLDGTLVNADLVSQTLDSNKIKNRAVTWDKLSEAVKDSIRENSVGGYVTDTIQILTYDADTVEWDLTAGVDATLDLAGDTYLKIINPDTPSYVTCYVTHTLDSTELTLPGRLPVGFSWATGTNQVTGLGGRYDGTTWWWTREIYEALILPPSYEAESTAFFAANTGLTDPQKDAVNDLVIALKAIGWSKFKVIYPMIGGSASAHKWNLVSPVDADASFRLAFYGTWTHDASGALPNGTNAYANTFFKPLIPNPGVIPSDLGDANINNFHFSYYSGTNTGPGAPDKMLFGYGYSTDNIVYEYYGTTFRFAQVGDALNVNVGSQSVWNGLNTISRTSSTSAKVFFQGSQIGTTNTGTRAATSNTGTMYLGAKNFNGTAVDFGSYKCQFFSIGLSLSDAEVTALNSAVTTFQTALTR